MKRIPLARSEPRWASVYWDSREHVWYGIMPVGPSTAIHRKLRKAECPTAHDFEMSVEEMRLWIKEELRYAPRFSREDGKFARAPIPRRVIDAAKESPRGDFPF